MNGNDTMPPLTTFGQRLVFALAWEWGRLRFFWFTRVRRTRLRTHAAIDTGTAGVEYSRKFFTSYAPDSRILWTMFLLGAAPDLKKDGLLVLGPRYETELLMARGLGFAADRIKGLDTHSYSPLVDVGDMHQMQYADAAFSAIICAWTLSYSTRPDVAAREMMRVLAPGGYLVVAVQKIRSDFTDRVTGTFDPEQRIQTLQQMDALYDQLERVAGFEPMDPGDSSHTLVAYRKPQ